MKRGLAFLGRDPQIRRADLYKDQNGGIYRKIRGTKAPEFVKRLDDPGLAPVAYSTIKRMGKPVQDFVNENELNVNQVKQLERRAKQCGFSKLSEITWQYELDRVLKKELEATDFRE